MGQSTPTTTIALDAFEQRYAAFRAELAPEDQKWFDELVCRARRHSNAINRRPHMDFERPVVLSMLLEGMREVESMKGELADERRKLKEVLDVLIDAGLAARRVSPPTPQQLGRLGQTRLERHEAARTLPA